MTRSTGSTTRRHVDNRLGKKRSHYFDLRLARRDKWSKTIPWIPRESRTPLHRTFVQFVIEVLIQCDLINTPLTRSLVFSIGMGVGISVCTVSHESLHTLIDFCISDLGIKKTRSVLHHKIIYIYLYRYD